MALQFDPGAYASIFEAAQNRKLQQQKMLQDSMSQIPQGLMDYQKLGMEQKRQDLMNQLTQGQIKQQNMEMSPLVPPGSGSSMPSGMPQESSMPTNGLAGGGSLMPSMQPSTPPVGQAPKPMFASAGTPDTGNSPVVQAWKSLPANHPFGSQQAPPAGGMGQDNGQPDYEQTALSILRDPTKSPIEQKKAQDFLSRNTTEDLTKFELPNAQAGLDAKLAGIGESKAKTVESYASAKEKEAQAAFMGSMGGKQGQMSLKLQDNFNKENKDTIDELKSAQTADGLIDAAKQNPVAYNALPLKLAKMLTGSSRININEIKAMGGSQAILDRAQQAATQMGRGTITNDNYQFMKGLTKVLVDSNKNELRNAGMRKAMQVSQLNKQDPQMNYQTIVGEPYGKETFGAMPSGQDQGMGGGMQIGRFKVTVH